MSSELLVNDISAGTDWKSSQSHSRESLNPTIKIELSEIMW